MKSELLDGPKDTEEDKELKNILNEKQHKTVKQTTYLVIPFALQTDYVSALEKLCASTYTKRSGQKAKLWKEKKFSRQRLFAHISNLIDRKASEKNESIGTRLVLEESAKPSFGLPNNRNINLIFTPDKENFNFSIGNVELYLFETQVGFVVFDILYKEHENINNIILSNYYLKKIYQYKDNLRFLKKTGRDQQVEVNVSLYSLVEAFLSEVQVETYFEDVKQHPSHAIVYSSALLESDFRKEKNYNKQLLNYLFQMRKSFKDTYDAPPSEYEIDGHNEIIQLFENSFWGVSLEGAAHIAYLKDNEADIFFKDTHTKNVREVYFYLYILALHQHYTLQYFSTLVSRLPANLDDYLETKKNSRKSVENLRSRMVFFTLRCAFKQVSHISHQTSLYEMFRRALRIEELMDELHLEIEALSSITEIEETRKSKKIQNIILYVTTFFILISTTNDSMGITTFIDTSHWPSNKLITPWVAGAMWTLIAGGSFYLIIQLLIRRK
ncbi:hypothetical protein ACQKOM_21950 [Peribacillus frigoritolerans]|uniref:hypothetical protein n=1 Tax=Peribacillus frigoritolerans TaxID=450367 RepID=UPI003D04AB3F